MQLERLISLSVLTVLLVSACKSSKSSNDKLDEAVARGRADGQAGRTLSQQQVAEELRRKWLVSCEKWSGDKLPAH